MKLLSLKLENYRNYGGMEAEFDPETPVAAIIGQNARGKTNILEAIYLLALSRSFRTSNRADLVKWRSEYARVSGRLETKEGETELEVFIGNPPHPKCALKKNGVKCGAYDFIGNCRIVFFHPEDLNILYLGPDLRRRYLDVLNIQLSSRYYRALGNYKKILEQRNSLLKNIRDGFSSVSDLAVWDERLTEEGAVIMEERKKTVDFINGGISGIYAGISGREGDQVKIVYNSFFDPADELSAEQIGGSFAARLEAAKTRDLQALVTTAGPHRDDLRVELNGRPIGEHASRGEYRSLLLALKLIELEYFRAVSGEEPILLLDDVFSELDGERQRALMEGIRGCQTILTSTTYDNTLIEGRGPHAGLSSNRLSAAVSRYEISDGCLAAYNVL